MGVGVGVRGPARNGRHASPGREPRADCYTPTPAPMGCRRLRDPGPCVTLHHPIPPSLVQRGRSAGTARHQQLSPGTPRTFRSTSQLGGRPNQRVSSRSGRSRRGYLFRSAVGSRAGRASSHSHAQTDRGNHHTHTPRGTHTRARVRSVHVPGDAGPPPRCRPRPPTPHGKRTKQCIRPLYLPGGLLQLRHCSSAAACRRARTSAWTSAATPPSPTVTDGSAVRCGRRGATATASMSGGAEGATPIHAASPPAFRATAPRPAYLVGDALEPARRRGGVTTSASGNCALGRAVVPSRAVSSRSTWAVAQLGLYS